MPFRCFDRHFIYQLLSQSAHKPILISATCLPPIHESAAWSVGIQHPTHFPSIVISPRCQPLYWLDVSQHAPQASQPHVVLVRMKFTAAPSVLNFMDNATDTTNRVTFPIADHSTPCLGQCLSPYWLPCDPCPTACASNSTLNNLLLCTHCHLSA